MGKSWTLDEQVSIVIPSFNQGGLLRETLQSVERSRNKNLAEVIIVDDGSTDPESCAYFEDLAHSPYIVIHQANRGVGAARNTGIAAARGEFILPLDSDNVIRETYLKEGVEVLSKKTAVGVAYGDVQTFGERSELWSYPEFDLRRMIQRNYLDNCALYRKSVWESVGGYDERMPYMGFEDWDFWMRVAILGWRFEHLSGIAFDYRVRKGSMAEGAWLHAGEILDYMFSKEQSLPLRIIKEQQHEIDVLTEEYRRVLGSRDYRAGHFLVERVRKFKRLLKDNKISQLSHLAPTQQPGLRSLWRTYIS